MAEQPEDSAHRDGSAVKAKSASIGARASSAILTPDDVAEDINPLHYAAAMGDKKTLVYLLQQHSDPRNSATSRDAYGRTALVYAVVSGKQSCAEILLKSGADVNATDNVDHPVCRSFNIYRRAERPCTGPRFTSSIKWSSSCWPMGQMLSRLITSRVFVCICA